MAKSHGYSSHILCAKVATKDTKFRAFRSRIIYHQDCVAENSLTMLSKILPVLFLCFFSIHRVKAQSSTISVSPLLTCDLTTFTCPGVSGCCTIGGCCGGGCCANGYSCINEGTSAEACCPVSDPTKCGTAASVSLQSKTYHLVLSCRESQR